METKCEICGKIYSVKPSVFKRANRHFCSYKCMGISKMGTGFRATCDICGKEYAVSKAHYNRHKHHYCSVECARLGQVGSRNHMWTERDVRICENCGNEFAIVRHKKNKFCSQKCMGEYKHKTHSVVERCAHCGKEIVVKLCVAGKKSNFCGMDCKNAFHSLAIEGINNPNWRGGVARAPYPNSFSQKLRNKIMNMHGDKCALCGIGRKDVLALGHGYGLAIHHIDYDKQNSAEKNLIPLCNICHGKVHYNRDKWKKELSKISKE
jgi:hypothetical protein